MRKHDRTGGLFYGWVIVISGALVMALAVGVVFNCFGQFIKPVCEDLGFSRRAMSLNQTLMIFFQIIVAAVWGMLLERFDLKRMMVLSAIIYPVSFFAYSLVSELWMFYVLSLLVGISYSWLSVLPYTYILPKWFVEKRGVATGLCFMGSGLGGMILNPVINIWLRDFGWRRSFQLLGLVMLVVMLPCVLLIKLTPEEIGCKPLEDHGQRTPAEAPSEIRGMTCREARSSALFWKLCLCGFALNIALPSIVQTCSPHLTDCGYLAGTAAEVLAVSMGAMSVGKVVLGGFFDRWGMKRASILSILAGLMGLVGVYFCPGNAALALIVTGIGLGCGFGTVGYPIILQNVFGEVEFGAIMGVFTAVANVGTALGPVLNGMLFDRFGSYRPAYLLWGGAVVLVLVFFWFSLPDMGKTAQEQGNTTK